MNWRNHMSKFKDLYNQIIAECQQSNQIDEGIGKFIKGVKNIGKTILDKPEVKLDLFKKAAQFYKFSKKDNNSIEKTQDGFKITLSIAPDDGKLFLSMIDVDSDITIANQVEVPLKNHYNLADVGKSVENVIKKQVNVLANKHGVLIDEDVDGSDDNKGEAATKPTEDEKNTSDDKENKEYQTISNILKRMRDFRLSSAK